MDESRSLQNPFTPTFGKTPMVLAGREDILEDMAEGFENGSGDPNLSSLLVGSRGMGKTALLSCLCDEALGYGWISASTSAGPGMLEDIIEQAACAAADYLSRTSRRKLSGLSVGPVSVNWDNIAAAKGNWRTRMTTLLEQLDMSGIGLLITVDEVTASSSEMIQLATVYQHFVREDRKVALVMAGLPFNVSRLLNDKTASFLRRATIRRIGPLSDSEVEMAITETVETAGKQVDEHAVKLCRDACEGFPYMVQLVGYHTWRYGRSDNILNEQHAVKGIKRAKTALTSSILQATCDELSPRDIQFLQAMAQSEGPSSLRIISERMDVKSNYSTKYKSRLLEAGAIDEIGKGVFDFALPGLREYVSSMPDISSL